MIDLNDVFARKDPDFMNALFPEGYGGVGGRGEGGPREARRLVRASMKYRALFDDEHPEYQIKNFDASWYQVKAVLKEYMPEELKKFRELVKKLADRMRPAVHGLGFLRK